MQIADRILRKVDKIPRVRVPAVRYALLYILASNMHTTSYWPRNWPLRRLRPFSPFPTKGATKSASQTPQGVRGVGRLSRIDRRFFRARNPAGDGHCRRFSDCATALFVLMSLRTQGYVESCRECILATISTCTSY